MKVLLQDQAVRMLVPPLPLPSECQLEPIRFMKILRSYLAEGDRAPFEGDANEGCHGDQRDKRESGEEVVV